jgi:hypothetical protein
VSARAAWFVAAVAVSTLAAWWRWPDSAHALGVVRQGGGSARHAAVFPAGPEERTLVATARVVPPYRGDARLVLEGEPPIPWRVELSRPAIDLGLHRWPRLEGDVLRGIEPGQRIALWFSIGPRAEGAHAEYRLALRDVASGESVLAIPIQFGAEGGGRAGAHH